MTKTDVGVIMGREGAGGASQPYRAETYRTSAQTVIDIWYYLTEQFLGVDEYTRLTPLVFEDGKLIGSGWSFLEGTANKYNITLHSTIRHR